MTEIECDVYRSSRKENLYLYVKAGDDLTGVPEQLMVQFGTPELTLSFTLHADRTLAREDPVRVMENLETQGYHLQLPPADEKFR
jgi:uncharacterized protein YcgL (UPF0745 family)